MVAGEQVSQKLGGAAAGGFNWEEIGMPDKNLGNKGTILCSLMEGLFHRTFLSKFGEFLKLHRDLFSFTEFCVA